MRKMASIQEINSVYPIPDADKICQYGVQGWRVVDQINKYKVGDLVIFCEIDSFISSTIAPFLTKPGHIPKVYNGVEGERLRTVRLRKVLSQGLILPLSVIPQNDLDWDDPIGTDVSELIGVQKWEPPPEFTSADAKGLFPSWIIKTDQTRIQSCYNDMQTYFPTVTWEMQEKVEGSSLTAYFRKEDSEDPGEFGVCSRNLNLRESEDNTFWKTAVKYDLKNKLTNLGLNIAIQGELCGPGIQGNIYGLTDHMLFVFDIYDIDNARYYNPARRRELTAKLGLTDAPVLKSYADLQGETPDSLLLRADGTSVLGFSHTLREGLVFKANLDNRISFKAVSNMYLERQK